MTEKKKDPKNLVSQRGLEELAREIGLSSGRPRAKSKRIIYSVRNAGQGQVKIRDGEE